VEKNLDKMSIFWYHRPIFMPETTEKKLRSPIVVVMGHVDHGKTSLLDYIRKTNVIAKEAGGITQSIGAYEIAHPSTSSGQATQKKITFIDTPGHEAFSKMRSRGAKVADLAILVVAADDGVKPQTKEAIQILKDSGTTFIVAINKIDKNNSDVEKVKNDLLQNEVLLEGFGGSISYALISAKTGEGVPELLDLILLTAEVEELTYVPGVPARGVVIEAKLDRRRGNEVMIVLKDGTLKKGDEIFTETAKGKVKILENFLSEGVDELIPSSPALILGFEKLPVVGEEFQVGKLPEDHASETRQNIGRVPLKKIDKEKRLTLRLILKANVAGSLEALGDIVKKLSQDEVILEVMDEAVGDITDGDVKLSIANGAVIFGFGTRVEKAAEVLASANAVRIHTANIIYELLKLIEEEINNLKSPKPTGVLEVLAVFNQKAPKQLIGGKVAEGILRKGVHVVERAGEVMGTGRIVSLEQGKKEVTQVEAGKECGMFFDSPVKIEVGDKLLARPQI
jgi:translation initiation factor IF-2